MRSRGAESTLHGHPEARRLKTSEGERESAPAGEVIRWAHGPATTLLQDMGADQGGADVRVPLQGFDSANSRVQGTLSGVVRASRGTS